MTHQKPRDQDAFKNQSGGSGKQALHVMTAGVVPKLESFSTLFGLLFASC
jgi:hypothetical protein